MTQGEKANRYDEIIEKAKSIIKNDKDHVLYEDDIIEIIPELKENKNWIPTEIIKYLKEKGDFRSCWISWLEKQGEQKSAKTQVENSPAWGEEDKKMLEWLCRIVHSQRVLKVITLKEETELGKWMDKWLNHNPQHTWKPSKEQMEALSFCLKYVDNDGVFGRQLVKLYQNLKNLREE